MLWEVFPPMLPAPPPTPADQVRAPVANGRGCAPKLGKGSSKGLLCSAGPLAFKQQVFLSIPGDTKGPICICVSCR